MRQVVPVTPELWRSAFEEGSVVESDFSSIKRTGNEVSIQKAGSEDHLPTQDD